ncbi:MAG TPA: hypothetical protein VJ725_27180 [Thermoanaerobaculia bacterium]|nr:hypothetical protein [Thermoanaerobaculia bacterium]
MADQGGRPGRPVVDEEIERGLGAVQAGARSRRLERNATRRPSALITGTAEPPGPAVATVPAARVTISMAPVSRSKTKMSIEPLRVSTSTCPGTRSAAMLAKATNRPSAERSASLGPGRCRSPEPWRRGVSG